MTEPSPARVQVRIDDLDFTEWKCRTDEDFANALRNAFRALDAISRTPESHTDAPTAESVADSDAPKLTPGQRYRDRVGDAWEVNADGTLTEKPECGGNGMHCQFDHVVKKWGPLTLIDDEQPTTTTVNLPCPDCGELIAREVEVLAGDHGHCLAWKLSSDPMHHCKPTRPAEPQKVGAKVAVDGRRFIRIDVPRLDDFAAYAWADVETGLRYQWADLVSRGRVSLGWGDDQ